ncbi:uncharacterized protein LOC113146629 [Cyclospora cayetanensis]|uniref:Uncharacterized protein LOC113146629 n=1 Tax=Cyclospora cayetanensis TaxID=88456 RepID=A0A6P6RRF6_9EIME|nr:uncharacterized protein LOC113146629 [Cyclospora cayetanensis]
MGATGLKLLHKQSAASRAELHSVCNADWNEIELLCEKEGDLCGIAVPAETKEEKGPRSGDNSPCRGPRPTPDINQQPRLLKFGEEASPITISIVKCPGLHYEEHMQSPQGCHMSLHPPLHMMQQTLVPSQQGSSYRNPLGEEAGEVGSKGALESFGPTFATELLADIELGGEIGSPASDGGAALAAAATGATAVIAAPCACNHSTQAPHSNFFCLYGPQQVFGEMPPLRNKAETPMFMDPHEYGALRGRRTGKVRSEQSPNCCCKKTKKAKAHLEGHLTTQ